MDKKTELMDLNDDCQFLILENLDFMSLLSVAETNTRYKSMIARIMKRIFRETLVHISLAHFDYKKPEFDIKLYNDRIQINNFTIAARVVNNFGHLIQKLELEMISEENANISIYNLVNLRCSKALKEISLHSSPNHLLNAFTNTFDTVQNLHVLNVLETDRHLNEIFPSIRRLDLAPFKLPNPNVISVKYKYLEYLCLYINGRWGPMTNQLAVEIIEKNAQIQSLKLLRASVQLVKMVADLLLPQLDQLNLDSTQLDRTNETIHFRNVKKLTVKQIYFQSFFFQIQFGNVEEFILEEITESLFGETGFLQRNKHLKRFRLEPFHTLQFNTALFKRFAHTTTTIHDIFIGNVLVSEFDLENVAHLINNNNQLEKLQIEFFESVIVENMSAALRELISDAWSLDKFKNDLILKRKDIFF